MTMKDLLSLSHRLVVVVIKKRIKKSISTTTQILQILRILQILQIQILVVMMKGFIILRKVIMGIIIMLKIMGQKVVKEEKTASLENALAKENAMRMKKTRIKDADAIEMVAVKEAGAKENVAGKVKRDGINMMTKKLVTIFMQKRASQRIVNKKKMKKLIRL